MLTLEQSQRALAAAEAHAVAIGVPVNIAIVDAGVHLTAFARMDGAVLGAIDVALGKARTAALFRIPSESVWDYCKPAAPAPTLELSNGGLMAFPGGLPLTAADGTFLGAVGVSGGAPSQDREIAKAATQTL
ncbi:GlcG/HbpS family heme-binding protein [Asticcacaulis machinosus]|uniref:Heme-binding protein n=1 Tax=Asticcacaulis machinosus TaxID=2984211 RepID=A0ABT5HMM1_9CAUL|nr:heme-binding protein [Asticcacaulis machinosus]MDC7677495.1 heme-binding protein [Asticcacaulis machinosus]